MQPMGLITGGMMGLSLMLEPLIPFSTGITYLMLNIVALTIGGILFGKDFFLKTVFASILSPVLVTLFEVLKIEDTLILNQIDLHYQLLVASIASGVLAGVGLGLVLRYNATTGGMDIFQKIINKYLKGTIFCGSLSNRWFNYFTWCIYKSTKWVICYFSYVINSIYVRKNSDIWKKRLCTDD